MTNQVVRDSKTGRFAKGNRVKSPGRPPGAPKTLVQALKERVDPDTAAQILWERAKKSDALLMYIYNRLEGMPSQKTENEHKGNYDITLTWNGGSEEQ